jgi:hypothetical protein
MERDDVRRAHRVERGGVEDRDDRRIGRVRDGRENLLVEPVEEIHGFAPRDPERPSVEREEAVEPRDPEQGHEVAPGSHDADDRDEPGEPKGSAARRFGRTLDAAATPPDEKPRPHDHEARHDDRHGAERDADDEEQRPRDSQRRHAEEVREPGEAHRRAPPRPPTEGQEDRSSHREVHAVQDE